MANEDVERTFKALLSGIGHHLKPRGFRKRGSAFRHLTSDNVAIIEVQRSQSGTAGLVRFTLNAGVICGRLLDEHDPDIAKAGAAYAHLRRRIGEFLTDPTDKWWDLDAATNPGGLLDELGRLLDQAAVYLVDHASDARLIALWESGQSPGLTDGHRQRLLRELKAAVQIGGKLGDA
jgi:hypothetical protein